MDEISIRKGHIYRIVVSDLEKKRAIWFGDKNRSKESMNLFYNELGLQKIDKVRLAVMDMWKALKTPLTSDRTLPMSSKRRSDSYGAIRQRPGPESFLITGKTYF